MSSDRSMGKKQILVIEDDADIQELLCFTLEREGLGCISALTAEEGLRLLKPKDINLVVLDIMLPGMSGIDALKRMKARPEFARIPVILASAKGEDPDVVLGLELGADDYVVKPYSPRVLVARIRRLLRDEDGEDKASTGGNRGPADSTVSKIVASGPFHLETDRHEAFADGHLLELSVTEYSLLELMVRNPGIVFSRSRVIETIYGQNHAVSDRAVDVQILGLRKKLGTSGDWIETVRGVGYRLKDKY